MARKRIDRLMERKIEGEKVSKRERNRVCE